jgi:hypothetical protein
MFYTQHSLCFVHCVSHVRLTVLFLTMFHVWISYVFTRESFCCYSLTVVLHVRSLYFVMLISAVHANSISHVNTSLYQMWIHWVILLLLFLTIFYMWTHLVSHVRKLTVLRLHLVFTREVVNHFRYPSFSLNSHVRINYLVMQGVLKQQKRCKQLWLDYSKIIICIILLLPIGIFCTLSTN